MGLNDENKLFYQGGLDQDSAPEAVDPNDYINGVNIRNTGTALGEEGYITNIESNIALSGSLLPGVNDVIGGGKFDDTGQIVGFRFNSAGNCQILLYSTSTQTYKVIYTDVTDSGGATLLPLNPQQPVTAILVNKTYLVWWAKGLEVGYTNLNTLASGGYGTVLWEDLSLLKPQCMIPPTWQFGSDAGTPSNFLYSNLAQFSVQYVNTDYNYSAWSTWSSRATPYQENTPTLGANVSQNNYLIVTVNIGSARANIVNIACRFGNNIFYTIKSVTRAYILALPNSSVNVATEVYEAYNSANNTYSFAFYNNTINIPVATEETALNYDYIWPANSGALINGNIIGLADWQTLYPRPDTSVTISAAGYNPNISIPVATAPANPITMTNKFLGSSGSGAGSHQRIMYFTLSGSPNTNDKIVIVTADIRDSTNTRDYSYVVPGSQTGNLAAVVATLVSYLPSASYVNNSGVYTVTFIGISYQSGLNFGVQLYFSGATTTNSIPSIPDNSQGQLALSYRDYKGRFLPLSTDKTYQWTSPSYAQVNGNAIEINWTINTPAAPAGAVDYQWLITAPQVNKIVDTIATLLIFKGTWNALTNTPTLAVNSGNGGDTYQITEGCAPINTAHYTNLGTNDTYNTSDYIVDNSLSYDVIPKDFGNLTNNSFLAFSLNALRLYDTTYQQEGVNALLAYDYSPGDRCTLHYWIGNVGAIATYTTTGGSSYTNGTYNNVNLTGGTGTGAQATITISGGAVTGIVITNPGTGYVVGDTLTCANTLIGGTGSGWSISVTALVTNGTNYFNNPCIDLAVLGYDAGNYIVKVENSAALSVSGGHIYYNGNQIDVRNIFLRLYSPALQNQTSQTSSQSTTVWYEIGQRFPITNGLHTVLNGIITDGGVYYKTRQFPDGILPFTNPPIQTIATDLNYSDFYPSTYWSQGRTRTYYDELEQTTQAASIITSQNYILGSKNNGLNRFYPSTIYGEGNGQTSSAQGGIQIMWQRGNILVIVQELNVFYCPVNVAYTQLNNTETQESISEALLNNGRYASESIGIGTLKAFCTRFDRAYFISPQYSEPFEIDVEAGIRSISGKMSKYFKSIIQSAVQQGLGIFLYYNEFYEELTLCIQSQSGVILQFPFSSANWNAFNSYSITPSEVNTTNNGAHCTASYNSSTGIVTYTPSTNYVGSDSATFIFNPGTGNVTVNNCLAWTAGVTTVNPFSFLPITNALLSTAYISNSILVAGPTIPVAISITGGTYSINGGAYTSSAGTTNAGDVITVKQTSSGSNSTLTNAVLTIGSTSGTFSVTTQASTPAYNVNIYNNSSSVLMVGGSIGATVLVWGNINPGGYQSYSVAPGTYTVQVKTGSGGTRYVNCTGKTEQSGGSGFTANFTGVVISSGSITVIDLQDFA